MIIFLGQWVLRWFVTQHLFDSSSLIQTEKAMAPHSSTLAWKTPWMEEPGRLQSMGSLSRTRLSNFTFTFHFHALEKEMATHSSVLAWRIPGMGEPGGLQSMGLHRVGHNWSDLAAAAAATYTEVFFFFKSHLTSEFLKYNSLGKLGFFCIAVRSLFSFKW